MFILGIQGSPRLNGNTNYLLSTFMGEAEKLGAEIKILEAAKVKINPCRGCAFCEKNGRCSIDDIMEPEICPQFRRADIIVLATPIYFYSCPAKVKGLIDRTQVMWSRRYMLNMPNDPGVNYRKGFLLTLGATKGKNLFEGMVLTSKYFFDAVNAKYSGSLEYRHIETLGDMEKHPTVMNDIRETVSKLVKPLLLRKKILFLSKGDSCRGQMAGALTRLNAGSEFEVESCGTDPSKDVDPIMMDVMRDKGIDMKYIMPKKIEEVFINTEPDVIVFFDNNTELYEKTDSIKIKWDIHPVAGKEKDSIRKAYDQIENKVKNLIDELK